MTDTERTVAVEANFHAFFAEFRHWPRARVADRSDLLWTLTDIPFPLFNGVLRARLTPERVDPVIEEVQAACRAAGVPILWWLGPDSQPTDLRDRLLARGFEPAGTAVGMALDLPDHDDPAPLPEGITVERVPDSDPAAVRAWCELSARGFGMPAFVGDTLTEYLLSLGAPSPLQGYLGRLHGEPVTTGMLYRHEGVAGVYNVATVPEARRQGIAAAVVRAALQDAKASGQKLAILHATAMGAELYRRLGFRDVCPLSRYVWRPV